MPREVVDIEHTTAEALAELTFVAPARLVLPNPQRGGPRVSELRSALAPKGRLRFSANAARLFVDIDPGEPEAPLIALDTIVRSDAAGLERMLFSVLPHVDEIVLGVDGRSDEETLKVALAYADCAFVFQAEDIRMSREAWGPTDSNPRGRINFAAARNLGRERVRAPWALVVDSDEYLGSAEVEDLRTVVRDAPDNVDSYTIRVQMGTFEHRDPQRLVRTKYRWVSETHNQIIYPNEPREADAVIVCDTSLRDAEEQERRLAQRDVGIDELLSEAEKGNVLALFHLAKHKAGRAVDIAEAVKLVEDFRLRVEPHSLLGDERIWAALSIAFRYYNEDNLAEAERWAIRALLDGPSMTAFCLLGDVAEGQGDLPRALAWYECACATKQRRVEWPGFTELRFGRRGGIERALKDPVRAQMVEVIEETDMPPAEPAEATPQSS